MVFKKKQKHRRRRNAASSKRQPSVIDEENARHMVLEKSRKLKHRRRSNVVANSRQPTAIEEETPQKMQVGKSSDTSLEEKVNKRKVTGAKPFINDRTFDSVSNQLVQVETVGSETTAGAQITTFKEAKILYGWKECDEDKDKYSVGTISTTSEITEELPVLFSQEQMNQIKHIIEDLLKNSPPSTHEITVVPTAPFTRNIIDDGEMPMNWAETLATERVNGQRKGGKMATADDLSTESNSIKRNKISKEGKNKSKRSIESLKEQPSTSSVTRRKEQTSEAVDRIPSHRGISLFAQDQPEEKTALSFDRIREHRDPSSIARTEERNEKISGSVERIREHRDPPSFTRSEERNENFSGNLERIKENRDPPSIARTEERNNEKFAGSVAVVNEQRKTSSCVRSDAEQISAQLVGNIEEKMKATSLAQSKECKDTGARPHERAKEQGAFSLVGTGKLRKMEDTTQLSFSTKSHTMGTIKESFAEETEQGKKPEKKQGKDAVLDNSRETQGKERDTSNLGEKAVKAIGKTNHTVDNVTSGEASKRVPDIVKEDTKRETFNVMGTSRKGTSAKVHSALVDFDVNPTPLYESIHAKDWETCLRRLDEVPQEAATWIHRFEPGGELRWRHLPLHTALVFNAPDEVIEKLLLAYPEAAKQKNDECMLPLHLAMRNGSSYHTVSALIRAFPDGIESTDRKGRTPLNLYQGQGTRNHKPEEKTPVTCCFCF